MVVGSWQDLFEKGRYQARVLSCAKDDCGNNGMLFRQSTCVQLISPCSITERSFFRETGSLFRIFICFVGL